MFGLSKSIALLLSFVLGFVVCAGAFLGGSYAFLASFKLRDIEDLGLGTIPDESLFGENPEVDILNLTTFELIDELKTVNALYDGLSINVLESRYALIINEDLDKLLSPETRAMPLRDILTDDGVHKILSTVYIGTAQSYECHAIDSTEKANPADGKENTRWYDPKNDKYVTGINATIAYFTLEDFASGNISTDTILDGVILADVLGYTYEINEAGKKIWYDKNGERIKGVMAVFADCTIDEVNNKINTVHIGELINYELREDGKWYEEGKEEPVHPFMNAVANSNIQSLGGLFDDLTISDLVPEDQRTGIFAILPTDTKLNNISSAVNESIENSPMQFFMNQGMISFEEAQMSNLDFVCKERGELTPVHPESEEFNKYYNLEGADWQISSDGYYLIPTWRTKSLNQSFSYIVGLFMP